MLASAAVGAQLSAASHKLCETSQPSHNVYDLLQKTGKVSNKNMLIKEKKDVISKSQIHVSQRKSGWRDCNVREDSGSVPKPHSRQLPTSQLQQCPTPLASVNTCIHVHIHIY